MFTPNRFKELVRKITNVVQGVTKFDHVQFETENVEVPTTSGALYWDDQDKTLSAIMEGNTVKLQIGQEMYVRAVNKTGSTIPNGSVVYISGSQGNRPSISLADADSYANSQKVIGVTTENIDNNAYGYVTTSGLVRDLNTNAYNEGDCVYLSTTAGQFTTSTPTYGKTRVRIGMILKSHNTDGWLCVKIEKDKYMFGDVDGGNYTYFEDDGTKVSKGNATVWDDINGSALQVKVQGVGVSIDETENSLDFTTGSNLSDYGFDNYQTPHSRKTDSDIYPHIHWVQKEDNVPNFLIQYRYQVNGQATESSWVNYKCNSITFTYVSGNLNQISYGEGISGNGLSSIIEFRILRDNSNASGVFSGNDPYSQTANIKFIDIHVEKDTEGSRQQYVK